ncbi:MAG: LacI family DNA-binding transcriptional regulator, partial [Ruminococcus sp.]
MAEKKRYQIGLMIHHLENEYATEVLKGAITAAEELDVNLILLPGRGINAVEDDEKYSIYDYQYNVIYSYVSSQNLDALIVSAGTVGSYISQKEMIEFLESYKDLPILTMEVEYPGYPCIHFNTNGMKLAVDHLIHHHQCREIGYVSGPMGNADAMERLRCYQKSLEENGIVYDSTKVVYGNFSESSEEAVRSLLDAHPDLDAICFANDKMCIGGYQVFRERGLTVGKDILVTGFDDSEVATSLKPMLTTIRTNVSDMGYRALLGAVELIKTGHTRSLTLDARLIVRESCGSMAEREISPEQIRKMARENAS